MKYEYNFILNRKDFKKIFNLLYSDGYSWGGVWEDVEYEKYSDFLYEHNYEIILILCNNKLLRYSPNEGHIYDYGEKITLEAFLRKYKLKRILK